MAKERIETGKAPQVEVTSCSGDLVIRSWQELGVQAKGSYELEEHDERILFSASGDLQLMVPAATALRVDNVSGDLLIKGLEGVVQIDEARGDAVLQNINQANIGQIHGDLAAKHLGGSLTVSSVFGDALVRNIGGEMSAGEVFGDLAIYYAVDKVAVGQCMGDANLKTINGDVSMETVHRDANFRNLGGLCQVTNVHGDIRVRGSLSAGEHTFDAAGDIILRWPLTAPLQLMAIAPEVVNRLPLQDVKDIDGGIVGTIGDGETIVSLRAGGRIILKEGELVDEKWQGDADEEFDMDFMIDFAGLRERISHEVSQSVASLTKELENSFGSEFADQVSEKAAREAGKAAKKAEVAAEKARRYAERQAARANRYEWRAPFYAAPERTAKDQTVKSRVSSEEQLKILRMVEKGTISPDEAATLLEALE